MPAQFSSYDQVEQPSLAGEMFGSPAKAWWTLQKGSLMMTGFSSSMWSNAMKGQGIKWGGVVGFRGIVLGSSSVGSGGAKVGIGLARALSPSHFVQGAIGGFNGTAGLRFKHFGLFGEYGLLNSQGDNKTAGFLGKLFGGGISERTKFTPLVGDSKFTQMKNALKNIKLADSTGEIQKVRAYRIWEEGGKVGRESENWLKAGQELRTEAKTLIRKNLVTSTNVRRLARIGRFASWTMAASIAFDVGSALGGFAVNTFGNAADKLEKSLANITNRQMEFGGKVGIGFYSGASGTERQRALSVIGRSGGPGMGGEAGYQHVDSTW